MPWQKYSPQYVASCEEWVAERGLIDYGGATLATYLDEMGLDKKTHYRWLKLHDDYAQALTRAKERFKSQLTRSLARSLAEAAQGYDHEETITDYVPNPEDPKKPVIRSMRKRKVHYQPNVGAAIFLLTNLDPDHYQNRQRSDSYVSFRRDPEADMTTDEIAAELRRLDKLDAEDPESAPAGSAPAAEADASAEGDRPASGENPASCESAEAIETGT